MSVSHFLAALAESGRVTVSLDVAEPVDADAVTILLEMDRLTRLNLAGDAPAFAPEAAMWAAQLLHRGCQFLVCRDLDATLIEKALSEPCPVAHSPSTDYSVDLTMQYLPDLIGMTRQVSSGDPLVQQLLKIAHEWPLSSVGVMGLEKLNIESFISDQSLMQLYVDRIIAHQDVSRLGERQVDHAVCEALGAFPELCGAIAKHLGIAARSEDESAVAA